MKSLLTSFLVLLTFTSFSKTTDGELPKVKASISAEYNHFRPMCLYYKRAGIPNFNSFGMNVGIHKFYHGPLNLIPRAGFNTGVIHFSDLPQSIELEEGAVGDYQARTIRSSFYGGIQVGYHFAKNFEVSVPIYFAMRYTAHKGYFSDNDGEVIESGYGANEAYTGVFGDHLAPGFKSGLEIAVFPQKVISFYSRFNFNYFAKRDVWNVEGTEQDENNGNIIVPVKTVKATGNWGFAVGMRFNLL